jgi:hypothetical protein
MLECYDCMQQIVGISRLVRTLDVGSMGSHWLDRQVDFGQVGILVSSGMRNPESYATNLLLMPSLGYRCGNSLPIPPHAGLPGGPILWATGTID